MNKTIIVMGVIALISTMIVSAIEIPYDARCDITMPATKYRNEITYPGIGIYGTFVYSMFNERTNKTVYWAELECFSPGRSKNKIIDKPKKTTPDTTTTCNDIIICADPVCHSEQTSTCLEWNNKNVCNWNKECTTKHKQVCEWEWTGKGCHKHKEYKCHQESYQECQWKKNCHQEQTTCKEWESQTVCEPEICHTIPGCTD